MFFKKGSYSWHFLELALKKLRPFVFNPSTLITENVMSKQAVRPLRFRSRGGFSLIRVLPIRIEASFSASPRTFHLRLVSVLQQFLSVDEQCEAQSEPVCGAHTELHAGHEYFKIIHDGAVLRVDGQVQRKSRFTFIDSDVGLRNGVIKAVMNIKG